MVNAQAEKELANIEEKIKSQSDDIPGVVEVFRSGKFLQVKFKRTNQVSFICTLVFEDDYPSRPIVLGLESRKMPETLLRGLEKLLDENAKKLIGQFQAIAQLKFLSTYLDENLFCCCFDEFQRVKKELCGSPQVEMKPKQKKGVAQFTVKARGHSSTVQISVPTNYPEDPVVVHAKDFKSTLPEYLTKPILNQATEEARKCVEAPLNKKVLKGKPFEIQPSFYKVVKFLIYDQLLYFKQTKCELCGEFAFPDRPEEVKMHDRDPLYVERVYCGHVFHFGCLHKLINTPPFNEKKKCPVCDLTIYHERWKETPEVLADRWSHKQAKQRELDEIIDFLE